MCRPTPIWVITVFTAPPNATTPPPPRAHAHMQPNHIVSMRQGRPDAASLPVRNAACMPDAWACLPCHAGSAGLRYRT